VPGIEGPKKGDDGENSAHDQTRFSIRIETENASVRIIHHGHDPDEKEIDSMENELFVHTFFARMFPRVSRPWTSSFDVGREQFRRMELTLTSGVVKKAAPRLKATFFSKAA
jgi:hypothetical protein